VGTAMSNDFRFNFSISNQKIINNVTPLSVRLKLFTFVIINSVNMVYVFSHHALEQMEKRGINKATVESVLKNPDQITTHDDLNVFQRIERIDRKLFLIRVFLNMRKFPNVVVTVYRTSKIEKYESKI
jgi:hypothetical protein